MDGDEGGGGFENHHVDPTPQSAEDSFPGGTVYEQPFQNDDSFATPPSGGNVTDLVQAAGRRRVEEEQIMADRQPPSFAVSSPFKFKVHDPCMVMPDSTMELAYWIYNVTTTTTLEVWEKKDNKVQHRFSDFVWLRDEIVQDHPGYIVPPLPDSNVKGHLEKVVLSDATHLNFRQRALTKFLVAVGAHPVLRDSPLLKGFCQLERAEFDAFKVQRKKDRAEREPSKMTQLGQKSKEGWFRVKGAFSKGGGQEKEQTAGKRGDQKLVECKAHATLMEGTIGHGRNQLKAEIDARKALEKSMKSLGEALSRVGDLEKTEETAQDDTSLSGDFDGLGIYAVAIGKLNRDQADKEGLLVLEMLTYYAGAYAAIRAVLTRLQRYEFTMFTWKDELDSAEAALAKAKDKDRAKAEKLKEEKEQGHSQSKEKFDKARDVFYREWEEFHERKRKDLRFIQKVMIELKVSYCRQTEKLQHKAILDPVFE